MQPPVLKAGVGVTVVYHHWRLLKRFLTLGLTILPYHFRPPCLWIQTLTEDLSTLGLCSVVTLKDREGEIWLSNSPTRLYKVNDTVYNFLH